MAFTVRTIPTDKEFFRRERNDTYDSWIKATPRELFQNSVDAGARTIRVTIEEADDRGSVFERPDEARRVTRIVFEDDGGGMDEDVIENVFFRPGRSSKNREGGTTIGGFGRARLATHLANMRYSITTKDRVVEGDGGNFVHFDLSRMISEGHERLAEFADDGPASVALRADMLRWEEALAVGGVQGCRMEIDIDPTERCRGEDATVETMVEAFTDYLKKSAVKADVYLNGEKFVSPLSFRRPTRVLKAVHPDTNEEVEFAKVFFREKDDAVFKRKMIVRVGGALMYESRVESPVQIVVEIAPALSRDVLLANRDGLKNPFSDVLDAFKQEMLLDKVSALRNSPDRSVLHKGEKGVRRVTRPKVDYSDLRVRAPDLVEGKPEGRRSSPPPLSLIERDGYGGLSYGQVFQFVTAIKNYETFLEKGDLWSVASAVRSAIFETAGYGSLSPSAVIKAIEAMGDQADDIFATVLDAHRETALAVERDREEQERHLKGIGDVVVMTTGDVRGKIADAMRRNDPTRWDPETGAGQKIRQILAMWEAYVDEAISTLMRMYPARVEDGFAYRSGFIYSGTSEAYSGGTMTARTVLARCVKDEDGERSILLNPLNSDGTLAYSPTDPKSRQRAFSLALHEATHLLESWHDEDFASVFTALVGEVDRRIADQKANLAMAAVREEYASARKIRSVAMDAEVGPRPTERLVAMMHPAATLFGGACADKGVESVAAALYAGAFDVDDDGVTHVDVESLGEIDDVVTQAYHAEPSPPEPSSPLLRVA